ncbi:hypothetical protein KC902_00205 [Candidatus Kaiserbacteria bacterium]|nr:hypothetical protein [Candidatus Kaiserbacteria bacterium]USN88651.1 MAG: hypothetical protein H6780_04150 [Candidatus Nomurabacteria bacterium]
MSSNRTFFNGGRSHQSWLYFAVFRSNFSLFLVLCLFGSFLLQPFHKVLANEELAAEVETVVVPVADDVKVQERSDNEQPEAMGEASQSTSAVSDEDATTPNTHTLSVVDDVSDDADDGSQAEEQENQSGAEDLAVDSVSGTGSATTTDDSPVVPETVIPQNNASTSILQATTSVLASATSTASQAAETSTEGSVDGADDTTTVSTETDPADVSDDEVSDSGAEAPSEDDEAELIVVNHTDDSTVENDLPVDTIEPGLTLDGQYLVTDDNYYQFSRQSCVAVGNGTYHCSISSELPVDQQSTVYSARDVDGDMEIFLKTKRGDIEQLTNNELDDASPQLDAESMQIVWQRFIDGRYQIILYDLRSREERQLTFSRTNNMEPKVSSEGIVWQAWDGHDWEIMYFDGFYTDQLTDNAAQDVAPAIEDGYVLWSVLGKDQQEAMVYSLESGESMAIAGHEGGVIENPRFVLVYDTKFDNGDVVTQGFDPATGLSAPIAAKPAEDPVDIPEADPTGEIRALIQNKSAQKEKDVMHTTPQTDSPDGDLNLATSTATSTDILNIKQIQSDAASEPMAPATTSPAVDFELTEYDLVIVPTTTPSTIKVDSVANVVVSTTSSSTQP